MIIIDTTESIFPSITNSKTFEYVSHKMSFISPTIPSTSVLWGFLTNLQSNYFIENHLWRFLLTQFFSEILLISDENHQSIWGCGHHFILKCNHWSKLNTIGKICSISYCRNNPEFLYMPNVRMMSCVAWQLKVTFPQNPPQWILCGETFHELKLGLWYTWLCNGEHGCCHCHPITK